MCIDEVFKLSLVRNYLYGYGGKNLFLPLLKSTFDLMLQVFSTRATAIHSVNAVLVGNARAEHEYLISEVEERYGAVTLAINDSREFGWSGISRAGFSVIRYIWASDLSLLQKIHLAVIFQAGVQRAHSLQLTGEVKRIITLTTQQDPGFFFSLSRDGCIITVLQHGVISDLSADQTNELFFVEYIVWAPIYRERLHRRIPNNNCELLVDGGFRVQTKAKATDQRSLSNGILYLHSANALQSNWRSITEQKVLSLLNTMEGGGVKIYVRLHPSAQPFIDTFRRKYRRLHFLDAMPLLKCINLCGVVCTTFSTAVIDALSEGVPCYHVGQEGSPFLDILPSILPLSDVPRSLAGTELVKICGERTGLQLL